MQLTFERSQKVCDGHEPAGFHYRDQTLFVMFNNGPDTLQYTKADTPESHFGNLVFSGPLNAIYFNDPNVLYPKSFSYSGVEHWIGWRKNESDHEHRIAKYLWRQVFILSARQVVEEELIRLNWQLQWQLFDPG